MLQGQERQNLEQVLLKNVKSSALSLYVKGLEAHVKKAVEAGIPNDNPYVELYLGAISKLKSI